MHRSFFPAILATRSWASFNHAACKTISTFSGRRMAVSSGGRNFFQARNQNSRMKGEFWKVFLPWRTPRSRESARRSELVAPCLPIMRIDDTGSVMLTLPNVVDFPFTLRARVVCSCPLAIVNTMAYWSGEVFSAPIASKVSLHTCVSLHRILVL
jgi:hypothetical protein